MKLTYSFHSFIRRRFALTEQIIAAAGLAALLYGLMQAVPSYPKDWSIAIVGAVFFISIWSPVAGYFLATLAAAYPLYLVSIYIAALFLAVAIIGQHSFIQNLGGALLTLASPLLGAIYLSWSIPLLGGLWWGPTGGALMGGTAAFFAALVAGMAGLSPDLLTLLGILPSMNYLPARFASANSLDVFRILLSPFAPNSSALLHHILQIASWAFVGWMVGALSEKDWAQLRRPKSSVSIIAIGALTLAVLQITLNLWLGSPLPSDVWIALSLTALFSFISVAALEIGQDFFEHPLPITQSSARVQFEADAAPLFNPAPMPAPKAPEMTKAEKPDDLIMLELD
jgi:hypothetical protein